MPEFTTDKLDPGAKQPDALQRRGPAGDAPPNAQDPGPRTRGGKAQEPVEDRPTVSMVTPENYPQADREASRPESK